MHASVIVHLNTCSVGWVGVSSPEGVSCFESRGGRLLAFVRNPPPPSVEVGQRPLGGGGGGGSREDRLGGGVQVGHFGVVGGVLAQGLGG